MKNDQLSLAKEKELVNKICAGEERALKEFYQTYGPRLLKFIGKKVSSRAEAEDIFQESLLASLDALTNFGHRSSLFSYLCAIARNKIADHYRKKKLKTTVFSQMETLYTLVSEVVDPETKLEEKEQKEKVYQALVGILPRYQQVLRLKYFQNKSVKEIAQTTNQSVKGVESALFRARKAFAQVYLNL